MDRREFLKAAGVAGLCLAVPHPLGSIDAAAADPAADLIIARGDSPALTVAAAIDALGGIKRFVSRGDIVVVKPNIGFDRTPEMAATTNPEVVGTVVKLCFEAGAKKVRVFDRPVSDPRRSYVQSGIAGAAGALGADVHYMDERKFKDFSIKGEVLKEWPLYAELFEADKVINLPIAKHHSRAKLTMAIKNWMGIMGGSRSLIHQRLEESIIDLSLVVKPTLTILDAVRILTANGPSGGSRADVKRLDTIVAGIDQVAVDAYGATLFGMKGSDLDYVRIAADRGLGTMDLSKLRIKKVAV